MGVSVSGRIEGLAEGGMAETIRRRLMALDEMLDDRLDPAETCALRARCRAAARQAYDPPALDFQALATLLGLPPDIVAEAFRHAYFGRAWKVLEDASSTLADIFSTLRPDVRSAGS